MSYRGTGEDALSLVFGEQGDLPVVSLLGAGEGETGDRQAVPLPKAEGEVGYAPPPANNDLPDSSSPLNTSGGVGGLAAGLGRGESGNAGFGLGGLSALEKAGEKRGRGAVELGSSSGGTGENAPPSPIHSPSKKNVPAERDAAGQGASTAAGGGQGKGRNTEGRFFSKAADRGQTRGGRKGGKKG